MRNALCWYCLAVVAVSCSSTAAVTPYTVTDLGTLPGGTASLAYGINDSGQVAGWSYTADGYLHAVLWAPVPEPSSLFALVFGLGAVGGMMRRRR